MKKFMLGIWLLPVQVLAQESTGTLIVEEPDFFISILAGVILALGFQLILTAMSVAGGITAVGNVRKKSHSASIDRQSSHESSDEPHHMNTGQKISTGVGLWTLLTTSISLFFASMLAVKLGLIGINAIGATIGLVIWAAFFMIITYMEISMVSTLVGGMVHTVKRSLSTAGSIFSRSESSIAKEVAEDKAKTEAREMRKQLEKLFTTHDVDKKVEDYVHQLRPQQINVQDLKKQIKDLLTHLQVTEKPDSEYPQTIRHLILEETEKSTLSKEDKQAIKTHVNSLKDIANSDATPEEKVKKGIADITSADKEKIDRLQDKIKETLRNTNNEEFQPERLEQDLMTILNEPGEASNIIRAKSSALDRQTLVKLLATQKMSEDEANKRISQAEKVLNKVSAYFNKGKADASSRRENMGQKKKDLESRIKGMFSGSTSDLNRIYSDFMGIFRESGSGPDLKYRLQHYNREEMTNMITAQTSLSRSEAEPLADRIVSARDSVVDKAREVQLKVNEKMQEAKEKALIAAEESRKTAATTAWWLVATGIISALASAAGGMLALESIF